MEEHGALYRKYRPHSFAEVKDQDHIVKVLEGAISKKEIPHALLFSGTRGTGKTTMARIFAQALGTSSVDLYEIDAASNRGIDDIRELKEAVHTLPFESTYKVYIVDEVHMLTKEAFNALLKTLEEPPAHVVFILATTEEEKVLDTILSRCQVFRFRSPSRSVLSEIVTEVAKKEGFKLLPEAADLIAVAADGSFRDALGLTQKVILASGDTIGNADEVATIIGAPRGGIMLDLVKAIHKSELEIALDRLSEAVSLHVDMKLFSRLLLDNLRAIILLRYQANKSEILLANFGPEAKSVLSEIAKASESPINSQTILKILSATQQITFSPIPHLPLELTLIDLMSKK